MSRVRPLLRAALATFALLATPAGLAAQATATPLALDVQLYPPDAGRLRFALSDSAYVVVFELQPGRGARVVYPAADVREARLGPGWHQPAWPERDPLAGRPGALLNVAQQPRALYLVASRTPLGLEPARRTPDALEQRTGAMTFQTTDLPALASALLLRALSVSNTPTVNWLDQLVWYRPGVPDPLGASAAPVVRCPDGRDYALRPGAYFRCP